MTCSETATEIWIQGNGVDITQLFHAAIAGTRWVPLVAAAQAALAVRRVAQDVERVR